MKKLRKRISLIILAFLVLTLGLTGCQTEEAINKREKTLVISTFESFEDMYRKNIFQPFEEKHNIKIVLELGTNSQRFKKLKKDSKKKKPDVVFLTDYYAMQGVEKGLFEKINRKNIPNMDKLYDVFKEPLGKDYGPAYAISSYGLAYNPDKVKEPITSWSDLWRPELRGKIALSDITVGAGPFLLMIAAEQANVDIKQNEDKAFEKLKEISEHGVKFYTKKYAEIMNEFGSGEIEVMDIYNYDIEIARQHVPNVKWVHPKEGSYALMETVNIVKGTKNKELAEEFIDWLLSEEVQKAQAIDRVESPVNKDVKLTEEQAKWTIYGEETIKGLKTVDLKYINESMDRWTKRWNKEINPQKNN
ncbi:spermidine/putrescine-binding periplasmic protein [Gottschalkia purinilytica]|uniref:Spermidine/putrescine-binding periplasmic protein n=1 Tax=Gottschalkia purinilytica TaxID=1503 RepID=A0A0L0W810_GOTPU|nr:ABC transporter substrate-binding protein [Gottschalkia purinilytica]KNF07576.1 spermidine/putrescine-binding periplasmic protein [Gottschalkia purinilytica]